MNKWLTMQARPVHVASVRMYIFRDTCTRTVSLFRCYTADTHFPKIIIIHPQHDFHICVGHTADYVLTSRGLDGGTRSFVPYLWTCIYVNVVISTRCSCLSILSRNSSIYLLFAIADIYVGANMCRCKMFKCSMCALQHNVYPSTTASILCCLTKRLMIMTKYWLIRSRLHTVRATLMRMVMRTARRARQNHRGRLQVRLGLSSQDDHR